MEKNFDNFFDLVHTFPLYRSKGMHVGRISEEKITGKFKGAIKIYQSSFEPKTPQIQSHEPVKVVVRVYIVKVSIFINFLKSFSVCLYLNFCFCPFRELG